MEVSSFLLWWIYRRAMLHFLVFVFCNFAVFTIQGMRMKRKCFFEKNKKHVENVYTKIMKNMLKYIFPPEFFVSPVYFRAFVLGFLYLLVIVLQLFTFERFAAVVGGFVPVKSTILIAILAFSLPLIEAASLPYLISMKLPKKYWSVSRQVALIVPCVWLAIAIWQNLSPAVDRENTGLFGATLPTSVGLWVIAFSMLWVWATYLVRRELPRRK